MQFKTKGFLSLLLILGLFIPIFSSKIIYWQHGNRYGNTLKDVQGPNLGSWDILDTGSLITGMHAQNPANSNYPEFLFGNGAVGPRYPFGWTPFIWVDGLKNTRGTVTSAKVRGEYLDWYQAYARCQGGQIRCRVGVVDFDPTYELFAGTVPEDGFWMDLDNPLVWSMGYNAPGTALGAEDTVVYSVLAGRNEGDDVVLNRQFFDFDVTKQVQWIIDQHTNGSAKHYAIVFLVSLEDTSYKGLVAGMSAEDCSWGRDLSAKNPAIDNFWTTDGNTMHLVVEGGVTQVSAEKASRLPALSGMALAASPNPFSGKVELAYSLKAGTSGTLDVFRADGKRVFRASLNGQGSLNWDAAKLPEGIYFTRLSSGQETRVQRLMLVR